jgi:hypothetical protein
MKVLPTLAFRAARETYQFGIVLGLACSFLVFAVPERSVAQEFRAILTGQVTDSSGAAVKGAAVTAVNRDTGTSYTAETSHAGVYYIPYIVPERTRCKSRQPASAVSTRRMFFWLRRSTMA